jgi:hypothetical protein
MTLSLSKGDIVTVDTHVLRGAMPANQGLAGGMAAANDPLAIANDSDDRGGRYA